MIHASLGFVKMSSKLREPVHPELTEKRTLEKALSILCMSCKSPAGLALGKWKATALHLLQAFGVLYAFCLQKE